jgi:hypothetical protein
MQGFAYDQSRLRPLDRPAQPALGAVHSAVARPHRGGPADVPRAVPARRARPTRRRRARRVCARRVSRRELDLPDFHALRHGCDGQRRRGGGSRSAASQELECDEGRIPGALVQPATLTPAGENGGAPREQGAERATGGPARRGRPTRKGELKARSTEALWKRQTAAGCSSGRQRRGPDPALVAG